MGLSVDVMVWDPDAVGCRDDSFKGGGWDPFGYGVDVDQVDGDYVELTVQSGETQGYIEKAGINVDAAAYPYLVLGLWGDGDYFIQVYDGAWKTAQAMGDAPDTYDIVVIDLGGVTTGTVTGIRLGVGSAAGKKATYDFFEFHSEQPEEPASLVSMRVLQREGEADSFESVWVEEMETGEDNIALNEAAEASSEYNPDFSAGKANDGNTGTDWASAGEGAGAWWKVTFPGKRGVNKVVIRDRPNLGDDIAELDLVFDDGSKVHYVMPPGADDGIPQTITFDPKFTEWIRVDITAVRSGTANVGLCEFEAYEAYSPFTKGHCIRIIAGRDSNAEKIFAGVIEESNLKTGGLRDISGRCFQVKLQAAAKTKSFNDRELSQAVKDIVEDFSKITTGRVKTPSPTIDVTKDYVNAHIADILDQLAGLPSKQSPYEAWRWKLGYGQDLRFRSENDGDVPTCSTQIQEGTNLLVGVKKGSDIYELFNKVKALSGLVENPLDDAWCESTTGWSTDADCSIATSSTAGKIRRGTVSLRITVVGDPTDFWAEKNITQTDFTEHKRVVIDYWTGNNYVGTTYLELRLYSAGGGHFRYDLIGPNENRPDKTWWHNEIDLDDPNWQIQGSPSWEDIHKVRIMGILGKAWSGEVYVDGIHFEADNLERSASDPSSPVEGDRVYVYKDAKINDPAKLQDLADGLLRMMKAAADRIMLPVVGAPDLQRGRKVTATSSTFGLSGAYIIAEAEHILSRSDGYITIVLLDRGRYALPTDLRRTLERELRLEKLGTVVIQ